jgi:hypothetical protein
MRRCIKPLRETTIVRDFLLLFSFPHARLTANWNINNALYWCNALKLRILLKCIALVHAQIHRQNYTFNSKLFNKYRGETPKTRPKSLLSGNFSRELLKPH